MLGKLDKFVSGGQTGVDRAALDFAIANGVSYGGWCPRGGWAEDHTRPPGLLAAYPQLRETPSAETDQRTAWNVRDSDATLIVVRRDGGATSAGTELTARLAEEYDRPSLVINVMDEAAIEVIQGLVRGLRDGAVLNVAGPRESEASGIYEQTRGLLDRTRRPGP